jgi:(4-(4-[2-(gamma-L-glutamylamino)ethyl]phenoxymethyl)furan-2-yl)methanamine synthase
MVEEVTTGWDLGGAHIKVVQVDQAGRLQRAMQRPCALWRGLEHLENALVELDGDLMASHLHGVTMTGELVDLFVDRAEGVEQLIRAMLVHYAGRELRFYAGEVGFLAPAEARELPRQVASSNWHAVAYYLAQSCESGLLIDIGSTTTDIVPFATGRVRAAGYSDEERLIIEELVYTGVTRTPIMALAGSVPFAGARQRVMAEHFATAADIYRLTGELPEAADQHTTADGRGKSVEESAARLARMVGRDYSSAPLEDWMRLAHHLAECQRRLLYDAVERILSRGALRGNAPLIGAGVGRFLVPELSRRLGHPHRDFGEFVTGEPLLCEYAARAAPAAAIAALVGRT